MSFRRRGPVVLLALLFLCGLVALAIWALRDDAPAPLDGPRRSTASAPAQPRAAGPRRPPERTAKPVAGPTAAPRRIVPPSRDPGTIELLSGVKVHVVVRRSGGGPASGAEVYALDPLGEYTTPPGAPVRIRKIADADGRADFDIAGGTTVLRFLASLEGEAAASDGLDVKDGVERTVELDLGPAVTPRIRVADANRTGIAGASVRIERRGGGGAWPLVVEGMTDGAGDATLPAIPTGDFLWSFEVAATAFGFAPARQAVGPTEATDGSTVIVLARAATVRGRCVDEAGRGIEGVSVRVAPQDVHGKTDADGRFSIVGLAPDGGFVTFDHRDFAPAVVGDLKPVGDDADVGDVVLHPGAPLTGVVMDLEGKPVAGASVQVANPAALWARGAETDAEGRFRFEHLAAALHEVEAKEPRREGGGWATVRRATLSEVRPGSEVRLQFTGALSVHVRFLDELDRSPVVVSSVKLTATEARAGADQIAWAWSGANLDAVRFQPGRSGVFDVTVEIPGFDAGVAHAVEVAPDRETRIEVLFRKTLR